ncbi:MAG: hypothetical protein HY517_02995 [Candidatus Aenigmarchaeota archaeon]|nr:hypothetical protein [Candidatus Aenigmarchaeota archaeon]
MAIDDIGYVIFGQILGMSQYPGAPFTGNIYRDLIMFLIVPSIFIILVIYSMTGRVIADAKLRMMLGVGAYLFILAGGYYSTFALLAGPYFIVLIFIVGLLWFFVGHFTGRTPHAAGGAAAGGGYSREEYRSRERAFHDLPSDVQILLGMDKTHNPAQRKRLRQELDRKIALRNRMLAHAHGKPPEKEALAKIAEIEEQIIDLEDALDIKTRES